MNAQKLGLISTILILLVTRAAAAQQANDPFHDDVRNDVRGEAPATQNSLRLVPSGAVAQNNAPVARGAAPTGDPTVPSPRIREVLEADPSKHPPADGQRGPIQAPLGPAVPEIHLKARVLVHGAPPVAVLEVGNQRVTVTTGTQLALTSANDEAGGLQLNVAGIGVSEVRLELSYRGQPLRILQLN